LKVTAEGIETEAQANLVQDMQCDFIQGYLTGRPAKAEDLAAFIMTRFAKDLRARVTPAAEPMAPSLKFGGE
jgi:EAL domain-containing protein (putative c-di-GMP-specific phosphodiesterase class I)